MLVRTDLPPAGQLVQVAHACLVGGRRFRPPDGCHLVLLAAHSTTELLAAAERAERFGVRCAIFEDPDEKPAVTALCSEAVDTVGRRAFRRYTLWQAPVEMDGINGRGRGPPVCFNRP